MKVMPYLLNTSVVGTLHKMRIRRCSYYKDQAHYSGYILAQGIELEAFIRINNRPEMGFVGFVVLK
jgi:hypothetical protein